MEILPGQRNAALASGVVLVQALMAFAFVALVTDSGLSAALSVLGLLLLLGEVFLAFLVRFFLALKGGVHLDQAAGTLRLGTMGERANDLVVPLARVRRVSVSPRWESLRREERQVWALELELDDGTWVALGEHDDHGKVSGVGRGLAERLGRPCTDDELFPGHVAAPQADCDSPEVRVGVHWHLFPAVTGFASLALVSGGLMLTLVTRSFFFGIVVAPFLLVMGAVLLAVVVVMSAGSERLRFQRGRVVQQVRLGARVVFENQLELEDKVRVRLRVDGPRGARIEIVSPTRILVLGNGLTARTRPSVGGSWEVLAFVSRALFPSPPAAEVQA
jgi:hypothetical protein